MYTGQESKLTCASILTAISVYGQQVETLSAPQNISLRNICTSLDTKLNIILKAPKLTGY